MSPAFDWSTRSTEPELLDLGVSEAEMDRSLSDLRFANRWLGGRGALLGAVRPYVRAGVRVLDVGCGSADLPALVRQRAGETATVVGLDLKPAHLRRAPPGVLRVAADVNALPFPPASFDVVTASLFLHHFDAPELPGLLRALHRLCRGVLVVNDLRRARSLHAVSRVLFPLLFRSPVSVNDGLVSIRRAFTKTDLRRAFAEAGLPGVRIRGRFPYRLVAVAEA